MLRNDILIIYVEIYLKRYIIAEKIITHCKNMTSIKING